VLYKKNQLKPLKGLMLYGGKSLVVYGIAHILGRSALSMLVKTKTPLF